MIWQANIIKVSQEIPLIVSRDFHSVLGICNWIIFRNINIRITNKFGDFLIFLATQYLHSITMLNTNLSKWLFFQHIVFTKWTYGNSNPIIVTDIFLSLSIGFYVCFWGQNKHFHYNILSNETSITFSRFLVMWL